LQNAKDLLYRVSQIYISYMVEEQNKAVDIEPCMHFKRTN